MKLLISILPLLQASEHSLTWHPQDPTFQYLPNKYSHIPDKTSSDNQFKQFYTSKLIANQGDSIQIKCPKDGFLQTSSNSPKIFNTNLNSKFNIFKVDKNGFDNCDASLSKYSEDIYSCDVVFQPQQQQELQVSQQLQQPEVIELSTITPETKQKIETTNRSFYGHIQRKLFEHDPVDWIPGESVYFISSYNNDFTNNLQNSCIRFVIYINDGPDQQERNLNEFQIYNKNEFEKILDEIENENGPSESNSSDIDNSNISNWFSSNFKKFTQKKDLIIAMLVGAGLVVVFLSVCVCCCKLYLRFCRKNGSRSFPYSSNSLNDYNSTSSNNPLTLSNFFRASGRNNGNNGNGGNSGLLHNNRSTINYSDQSHIVNVSSIPSNMAFYKSQQANAIINASSYNHPILNRSNSQAEYSYHPNIVSTIQQQQNLQPDHTQPLLQAQNSNNSNNLDSRSVDPTIHFSTMIPNTNANVAVGLNNNGGTYFHNSLQQCQNSVIQAQNQLATLQRMAVIANAGSNNSHSNNSNSRKLSEKSIHQKCRITSSNEQTQNTNLSSDNCQESSTTSPNEVEKSSNLNDSTNSNDISIKNPSKDSACGGSNMTSNDDGSSSSSIEKEINANICTPGTVIEV